MFKQFLQWMSILALDVNFPGLECADSWNYYHFFLLSTLLPISIILVGASLLKIVVRCAKKYNLRHHLMDKPTATFSCGFLVLIYAPVSKAIASIFVCTEPLGGVQYLLADVTLQVRLSQPSQPSPLSSLL